MCKERLFKPLAAGCPRLIFKHDELEWLDSIRYDRLTTEAAPGPLGVSCETLFVTIEIHGRPSYTSLIGLPKRGESGHWVERIPLVVIDKCQVIADIEKCRETADRRIDIPGSRPTEG